MQFITKVLIAGTLIASFATSTPVGKCEDVKTGGLVLNLLPIANGPYVISGSDLGSYYNTSITAPLETFSFQFSTLHSPIPVQDQALEIDVRFMRTLVSPMIPLAIRACDGFNFRGDCTEWNTQLLSNSNKPKINLSSFVPNFDPNGTFRIEMQHMLNPPNPNALINDDCKVFSDDLKTVMQSGDNNKLIVFSLKHGGHSSD